jgi:glucokinase
MINHNLVLAVDIGGSKASFAIIDNNAMLAEPVKTIPVPFNEKGVAEIEDVIALFAPFLQRTYAAGSKLLSIGLSLCGNVTMETGEAVLAPNLHWRNVPIGALLSKRYQLPVFAATDVYMAGLAELVWGKARGSRYFAWATIGTGFGGYLFLDGKAYGGYHGFAGNFGHNTLDETDGFPCGCGKRGCLETYVAGPAIARAGQKVVDEGRSPTLSRLASGRKVSAQMVFQAEAEGDPAANEIIAQVVRRVAIGLSGLVNILDLELIVLGGGVVKGSPDFVERIDKAIRTFLMTEEAKRDFRLEMESFENSALFGAGAHAFQKIGLLP